MIEDIKAQLYRIENQISEMRTRISLLRGEFWVFAVISFACTISGFAMIVITLKYH